MRWRRSTRAASPLRAASPSSGSSTKSTTQTLGGRQRAGARIVCSFALRETEWFFPEDLALAVAAIRLHRPDDVFVALPWSRPDLIEACLDALMKLPIEVHLG